MEVDGDIVFFNEAEAVNALVPEDEEKSTKPKNAKTKGKRTADIKDLPVIHVDHKMTESELITELERMVGINWKMKSIVDTASPR